LKERKGRPLRRPSWRSPACRWLKCEIVYAASWSLDHRSRLSRMPTVDPWYRAQWLLSWT
jgi:hypothetical protein